MILAEFLASPQRNAWLTMEEPFALYARKAHRLIQGEKQYTFDIATIEVQEEVRGTGVLKRFLPQMEALAKEHGFDGIFVESIQEPRLLDFLKRQGYTFASELEGGQLCPSVFKAVQKRELDPDSPHHRKPKP